MLDVSPPVAVRRVREADHAAWHALWRGYLDFYRAQVPEAVTARTFARLCEGAGGMLGLVAVPDGEPPIGLAHLIFHEATWSASGSCYLEDLYVDRGRRGTGAARRLIEAGYATARERGCDRIYWHTQQFNGPARSLYDTVATLTSFAVYEHALPVDGR